MLGSLIGLVPLVLASLLAPAVRSPSRSRATQPVAHIADSRYRKSTGLYERLEQGREGGEQQLAPISKPVLLAPAGGWPQVDAAIKAGADAIYFGCAAGLNARARATNFGEEELPALMAKLHTAGLEGYMCVNVLVYESEMAQAEQLARAAEAAGVDGLIVQDVGLASRLHAVAPTLPLHASTQMSISDADGARFAAQTLGARTVVLTRELSIDDIAAVTAAVPEANVEIFVHGHMCVSYNGQCFSSEAWGGRSANRGQCAQQCRMPYGLMVDGELRELSDASNYLLSPQDLCGVDQVPRLLAAGARTFKIEGRLKSAEYVYVSTLAYRRAIDEAWAALAGEAETEAAVRDEVARELRATPAPLAPDALRQVFARGQDEEHDGHSPGFFEGPRHQEYVRGLSPSHRGVCAGTVLEAPQHNTVRVRLRAELSAGDGVSFGSSASAAGGTLWGVHEAVDGVWVGAGADDAGDGTQEAREVSLELEDARKLAGVRVGDLVWRTQHVALQRELKGALADTSAGRALVDVTLAGELGQPLTVKVTDGRGRSASAHTEARLEPATGKPLGEATLRKAVGQLGSTPLMARHVHVGAVADGAWLPLSQLKDARRLAVERLVALRAAQRVPPPTPTEPSPTEAAAAEAAAPIELATGEPAAGAAHLSVLCRTMPQVEAAAACSAVDEIVVDFLELDGVMEALRAARPKATVVAAPRIIKPAEEALWRVLLELEGADAILVRSAGLMMRLSAMAAEDGAQLPRLHGDFSLNVANSAAARAFLELDVHRLAPTFDLNALQLCDLAAALPASERARLEVVVHTNVPIFHTEHCVFARRLSSGNSYKDCGHPCTRHTLHLVDEQQHRHHVLADSGCRNTVFNAQPQSAAPYLAQLMRAGVRNLRVELTDQPGDVVGPLLQRYAALARGEESAERVFEWLDANLVDSNGHKPGVTTGSFRPTTERAVASLRPTAAEERAKAKS